MMRPFWRYYGGKYRVAPRYGEPLPGLPIIEPFAGAAGYATRFGADRDVILVEKYPVIAGIWRWLISATPDDVLAVGDVPEGGTVDDVDAPQEARWLLGFWMNNGVASPCKRPSAWIRNGGQGGPALGWPEARARIAAQVPRIRGWRVIEGTYTDAPDVPATWFVDPPYSTPAGRHYVHDAVDFPALGAWCQTRRGRVIVCEQEGADWLPFRPFGHVKPTAGANRSGRNVEVVWTREDALVSPPVTTRPEVSPSATPAPAVDKGGEEVP